MKKIITTAFTLGFLLATAQSQIGITGHLSDYAVYDDFSDADQNSGNGSTEYSYETGLFNSNFAQKGIYWSEADGSNNGFVAVKNRDAANNKIVYTLSQQEGKWEPIVVHFGQHEQNKFTLDLSKNANVSFNIKNPNASTRFRIETYLVDINGEQLNIKKEALNDDTQFWRYYIGFSSNTPDGPLNETQTKTFSFDFKNAIFIDYSKIGTNEDFLISGKFDYTKVTGLYIMVVNDIANPSNNYAPIAYTNQTLEISNFKIGDQTTTGINGHISDYAVYDDFADADSDAGNGNTEYSYQTSLDYSNFAKKGIFWSEANGSNNGFVAVKNRDAANNKIVYTLSQEEGKWEPIVVHFGKHAQGKFTLDLSKNANVSFNIKNTNASTRFRIEAYLVDINGVQLNIKKEALNDDTYWWKYFIGFSSNTPEGPLKEDESKTFSFDFKNAIFIDFNKWFNNQDFLFPDMFDYSKVTGLYIMVVNDVANPANNYAPIAYSNQTLEISDFKMGDQTTLNNIVTESNEESTNSENLKIKTEVYNIWGEYITTGYENELKLNAGVYIFKTDKQTKKVTILN